MGEGVSEKEPECPLGRGGVLRPDACGGVEDSAATSRPGCGPGTLSGAHRGPWRPQSAPPRGQYRPHVPSLPDKGAQPGQLWSLGLSRGTSSQTPRPPPLAPRLWHGWRPLASCSSWDCLGGPGPAWGRPDGRVCSAAHPPGLPPPPAPMPAGAMGSGGCSRLACSLPSTCRFSKVSVSRAPHAPAPEPTPLSPQDSAHWGLESPSRLREGTWGGLPRTPSRCVKTGSRVARGPSVGSPTPQRRPRPSPRGGGVPELRPLWKEVTPAVLTLGPWAAGWLDWVSSCPAPRPSKPGSDPSHVAIGTGPRMATPWGVPSLCPE